jgi:Glycosyl hydrolases family 16
MKVWASASAIGLTLAYSAAGCSSEPPSENGYVSPAGGTSSSAGTSAAGAGAVSTGATSTGGSATAGNGNGNGGGGDAGAAGTAGSGAAGTGGTGMSAACPTGVDGHCKAGATYPEYPGYTLKLVEEFDEPLDLNTDPIWTWSDGSPQDGQTRFREDAIQFEDGYLTITADVPMGCAPKTTNAACVPNYSSHGEAFDPNESKAIVPMGVWSGELRTKYNNYRYGRYETKLAAPTANPAMPDAVESSAAGESGNFLSTLFVFRTPKNVDWNEIDIELEPWGTTSIYGNVVNAKGKTGYPGGAEWNVLGPQGFKIYDEHVYAFEWTPTKVEWFVDGEPVHEFTGTEAVAIPTLSAKVMMNLWIFGANHFGNAANNKYPFTAKYDWFRFYKLDTETTYPCSPTPSCLPDVDRTKSSQNNPKEVMYGQ